MTLSKLAPITLAALVGLSAAGAGVKAYQDQVGKPSKSQDQPKAAVESGAGDGPVGSVGKGPGIGIGSGPGASAEPAQKPPIQVGFVRRSAHHSKA